MYQAAWLKTFGFLTIISFMTIAGGHALCGDTLLFQSDFYSLILYLGAMTLAGVLILLPLSLPLAFLPVNQRKKVIRATVIFCAVLILTSFMMMLFLWCATATKNIPLLKIISGRVTVYRSFIVSIILSSTTLFLLRENFNEIVCRVEKIGTYFFLFIFAFVLIGVCFNHLKKYTAKNDASGKHLVLILLDGMPTQFLRSYNPDAELTSFDKIFQENLLFKNFRTTFPVTNRFFGILYSGDPKIAWHKGKIKYPFSKAQDTLLSMLHKENVSFKFICWHRNGTPEGSGAQTRKYCGLRSYFLTNNTFQVPKILGLHYHINIASRGNCIKYIRGHLGRYIYDFLNTFNSEYIYPNADFLIEQICSNQKESKNSLTIISTKWTKFIKYNNNIISMPDAQGGLSDIKKSIGIISRLKNTLKMQKKDVTVKKRDYKRLKSRGIKVKLAPDHIVSIRENNYRYNRQQESYVLDLHNKAAISMQQSGNQFSHFLDKLNAKHRKTKPPTIILTADHGSIYGKGRLWYGYHPNEEVIRVPFAIINGDRVGIDNRFFETLDLTASILDFFDINIGKEDNSLSVFKETPGHDHIVSLTSKANIMNEWLLVISGRDEGTYRINLHPAGAGEVHLLTVDDSYHETIISEIKAIPRDIKKLINDSVKKFGLPLDSLHTKFQKFVAKGN